MLARLRILILAALPATASADTYTVDAAQSSVGFSVTHMLVNTVSGSFGSFSGTMETNEANVPTAIRGEVQIVSVNTQKPKRDKHLQASDFFDAPRFPKASFVSSSITPQGEGYAVKGQLTIRDVTREATLTMTAPSAPADGQLKTVATTTINRQDFGVSWSKLMDNGGLAVSNEVQLTLTIALTRQAAE